MNAYFKLTAPGITLLVMMTGLAGMWMAVNSPAGSSPSGLLLLWATLGIGLASSGASVLNNYYDRDIDGVMKRTAGRPLPTGKIGAGKALLFGLALTAVAALVLAVFVNTLAAVLALSATAVYSYIYTVLLKRRTPYATELGGISGALPPVIGWASVTGSLNGEAALLFALLFFWQPPHFWSLALKYRKDYANAGVPTMPVKRSQRETNLRSLVYVALLFITSVLIYSSGIAGSAYLFVALFTGLVYLALILIALRGKADLNRQLFVYSIVYLSVLFTAMAIDAQ